MTMMMHRRRFLQLTGVSGAGLILGVVPVAARESTFSPTAFLQIDDSGSVTLWIPRQEMGQGVRTSLAMLIAEELDASWDSVRVVQASLDSRYGEQRTGGSLSIRELWEPLRRTGADARHMLVAAAALQWRVRADRLRTRDSTVLDPQTGRMLRYGDLVGEASTQPVPVASRLREPSEFRLIGRDIPRIDGPDIVEGRAQYGIDVRRPGMLYASFERAPVIGGQVLTWDGSDAMRVPGVRAVLPIDGTSLSWMLQWSNGIAVVAESSWAAMQGREALQIEWDDGEHAAWNQHRIVSGMESLAERPGTITRDDSGHTREPDTEERYVRADYIAPYLSHSPLEPMNCVAEVTPDGCEIWAPCQFPGLARAIVARATGLDAERVQVHPTLIGGGFGRRIYADYCGEAALISKAVGRPVQLLFTRVDDTRHGFYRPISHHRMEATIDRNCHVVRWNHRITGPSRDAVRGEDVETPERSEVYGANQMPYAIENVRVEFNHFHVPIPCGPWRSVAYSQSGFVIESFIDELAHAAGADPVEFRDSLLTRAAFTDDETLIEPWRMRRVLRIAAGSAGWGSNQLRSEGMRRGRGVAVTMDHGSAVAHVAEVSVGNDGALRVDRFVSVIDCGAVVHPGMVRAQVEGAIAMGLSAAIGGEITIDRGRIVQSSYRDYEVLRIDQMPRVEVEIVPSAEPPGGVGEPPVPGVAPALLNALFAATGIRVRRLPVRSEELAVR